MKRTPDNTPSDNPSIGDIDSLASIRSILLSDVRDSLANLESQLTELQHQSGTDRESLHQQLRNMLAEMD